jgi:hypothetical protein
MNGTAAPTRKPIWPWLLTGCLALFLAVILGGIYLVRVGSRKLVATVEERIRNPKAREELAREMLRADTLPAGYHPVSATFDVPFVTHVRLSDRAPDAEGAVEGYDQRGFFYTESAYTESSRQLEAFFTGASGAPPVVETIGIRVRAKEDLGRGAIEANGMNVRYRTIRGRVEEADREMEGLVTLMFVDCAGTEKKERIAIWFGPEGSDVGDENAMRGFLSHFALCRPR